MSKHCWHRTGSGSSHMGGGSYDVICCYCGKRNYEKWSQGRRSMYGHGLHYRERFIVNTPPSDDSDCQPISVPRLQTGETDRPPSGNATVQPGNESGK